MMSSTRRTRVLAAAAAAVAASTLAGCGEDRTEAQSKCVTALETRLGEDGVVKIENLTENSTKWLTKVEGDLVYRLDQGAGDRVETWFVCQVDETGRVSNLIVKD